MTETDAFGYLGDVDVSRVCTPHSRPLSALRVILNSAPISRLPLVHAATYPPTQIDRLRHAGRRITRRPAGAAGTPRPAALVRRARLCADCLATAAAPGRPLRRWLWARGCMPRREFPACL